MLLKRNISHQSYPVVLLFSMYELDRSGSEGKGLHLDLDRGVTCLGARPHLLRGRLAGCLALPLLAFSVLSVWQFFFLREGALWSLNYKNLRLIPPGRNWINVGRLIWCQWRIVLIYVLHRMSKKIP